MQHPFGRVPDHETSDTGSRNGSHDDHIGPRVNSTKGAIAAAAEAPSRCVYRARSSRRPATEHVIASLVADMNMDSAAGAAVIDQLSATGLLTTTKDAAGDRVRCQENVAALVSRLADVYDSDRIQLISQMTQNALDRVRTSALRAFSSAIRPWKEARCPGVRTDLGITVTAS